MVMVILLGGARASAQDAGSIRGMVFDEDFDARLPGATITIVETGAETRGTDNGNYVFPEVTPGTYTLVFYKEGYTRKVQADVLVTAGQLVEVDAWLAGDFEEMDEFVVQVIELGAGTEIGLLELRANSPALIDSISADLMSQAGAGDAASALNLVAGASVQDGKFAVIRGLPDRYVNTQLNGVRLPTADPDKRAVELDQFSSAVIESIQVSKTFTPDQQGDASGGAVNITLKGIPEASFFQFGVGTKFNSQTVGRDDFLTYRGGGVNYLGLDGGGRDRLPNAPTTNSDAVGVSRGDAPFNYDYELGGGISHTFDGGLTIGALVSYFHERDSSFFEDGVDDSWWVENPGERVRPQSSQGAPNRSDPESGDFRTSLFDVTQGSEEVQWGGMGAISLKTDNHALALMYLHTHTAEDTATLAEDTRGKEFYFPGYDPG
ncbi:MAG: carboxypeptidase regulatory-like domain-containing protein [Phycisphaeraceae bacterium]